MDSSGQYFCPRLVDYIVIVGTRHPNRNNTVAQTPELLRRYPTEDHKDFYLPPDVVFFCQPEGCISVGPKRVGFRDTASFVFSLTEKDSARVRYGICVNFYRPFDRKIHRTEEHMDSPRRPRKGRTIVRNHTLTSLCLISHHPFFSTFREALFILRRTIETCNARSGSRRSGGSSRGPRDQIWSALTGQCLDNAPNLVVHEIREIETWILRLLSAPVPVPGKTKVELEVLPHEMDVQSSLIFALPDHTRLSLVDFPLHLPLELLGVDTVLKVLTCIILEHKIVLMSRDYNALTMSVMAFVSMLYPLEYMFPVIPLLPTCMTSAEQLLLAPTPYIIGVPASFFMYKKNFCMPTDVWLVDLDANKINQPTGAEELPPLPEPEATVLKNHLRQTYDNYLASGATSGQNTYLAEALASMSMTPQPIKNLDAMTDDPEILKRRDSFTSSMGFNPLIYGNDVDSVDVATRVAMVRFFNSPNTLGNFQEHTRTLRLYPRPVVAFQFHSFMKSRQVKTPFTARLARTQAVEYFAEFSLSPDNVVFLRVQTGVFDPALIGDKPRWYSHTLQRLQFHVYKDDMYSLRAAITSDHGSNRSDNDYPTDESGDDSDGAESTSSSYSSLSDFVSDIMNSDINGDTPGYHSEDHILSVDQKQFPPPSTLHVPDASIVQSDSAYFPPESDNSSSASSSPAYSTKTEHDSQGGNVVHFRYDSGNEVRAVVPPPGSCSSPTAKTAVDADTRRRLLSQSSMPESPTRSRSQPSTPQMTRHPSQSSPSSHLTVQTPSSPSISQPTTPTRKSTFKEEDQSLLPEKAETIIDPEKATSFISSLSNGMDGIAQSATSTFSGFFGSSVKAPGPSQPPPPSSQVSKLSKPFTPLGTKKALVEKSGLVKHATAKKAKELTRQVSQEKTSTHSENQQFLKDIVQSVLDGQGVGWLKINRLKKLMDDENYRNFVGSRLNTSLDKRLSDDDIHVEDVCVSRSIFKGMLTVLRAMILGLDNTYRSHGVGGMASVFMVLEIAHTHYWARDVSGSNRSDSSMSQGSSPFGSQESLASKSRPDVSLQEEAMITLMRTKARELNADPNAVKSEGSPVVFNGDEFENIDIKKPPRKQSSGPFHESPRNLNEPRGSDGDILREMVKNKELMKSRQLHKISSIDSEASETNTMLSSEAGDGDGRRRSRINHHRIRGTPDTETDTALYLQRKRRSNSLWSSKSSFSAGYRFHDGKLVNTSGLSSPEPGRMYLFEGLIGKDRCLLWDQMQFWEDAFLDQVAQERDIIGMDQGPSEMIERYMSLGDGEKKRLEHDEDRLLSILLYNMVAFLVMLQVNKTEIKKKVRRLLGKSHIGLLYSSEINDLLDQIHQLHGNDIDLKPMSSRMMQKQAFTVHWGQDNTGDMLFMEVCDDCIILRSVTGTICDRWWYEKLVNMTYCPKTKVLCLWRKHEGHTQLNKFYTKKCKELYYCVKDSMEKAAARNNGKVAGPELGGEFPVQDLKTGQGGLLQVCMEGIGLLFQNSKDLEFFIDLSHIKKCYTQKGTIFIIEEFDPKNRKIILRKFKSNMADQIAYAVLCVFSYIAAGQDQQNHNTAPNKDSNKSPHPSPLIEGASTTAGTSTCSTARNSSASTIDSSSDITHGVNRHESTVSSKSVSPQQPRRTMTTNS